MKTPRELHRGAGTAVSTAIQVLKMEQPTFEAFLRECRDMENFGHIVDPRLYKDPERKAVSALMQPLFARPSSSSPNTSATSPKRTRL
jgi:hypothetical protein